jgi:hypothetical protein
MDLLVLVQNRSLTLSNINAIVNGHMKPYGGGQTSAIGSPVNGHMKPYGGGQTSAIGNAGDSFSPEQISILTTWANKHNQLGSSTNNVQANDNIGHGLEELINAL